MICAYQEDSADWKEGGHFLEDMQERRASETTAGPSNRLAPHIGTINQQTSNAVRKQGETWDEPIFERFDIRKGTEIVECMISTDDNPSTYLAGYFKEWSQNEAHLRIPVQDKEDIVEWVDLRSSRFWRGASAHKHWTHIGKGLWKPKALKGKGRLKKKQKVAHTESEDLQDTDNVYSGRQGSLNTMSTSLAMRASTAQEEGSGEAAEDPEISKMTDAKGQAAEMSLEEAQAIVEQRRKSSETSRRFSQFVKGHLERLKEKDHLNATWVKGCNWESGNTEDLRPSKDRQVAALGDQFSSAETLEKLKLSETNVRGRSRDGKVVDGTLPKQQSPRSASPSTPNKAERGNSRQQQNSSSEDYENRATHTSPTLENASKPGRNSAASPRSIGNGSKQAKASRASHDVKEMEPRQGDKPEPDQEQNSGSSSSSGKAMQDLSPDTVLLDGPSKPTGLLKSRKGFGLQELTIAKPPVNGNGHLKQPQKNGARKLPANLPVKKRIKLALVETDPFSVA